MRRSPFVPSSGMALLAVLFALTLLMLLALPFAVSMSVGADAAAREAEDARVQQASASVRDLLLDEAALSHPAIDPTPMADGLDEYPGDVSLPKEFAALREDGKVRLGGGAIDLQRFLPLEGASPLLIANVLGSTTRLREELLPDASEVALDDASNLPPSGMVYVGDELIRYGERTGTALRQLERGVLYPEFGDGKQPIPAQELVLDWRCVVAASWPAQGPDPSRKTRRPFRTVEDLLQVEAAGYGGFTPAELDRLRAAFAVDTMATTAPTWGRPERVFVDLVAGESKVLVVKSSMHLGPGSTVRLRNTRTGDVEFGLVMASATQNGVPQLQLPSTFMLRLLHRVLQAFPAVDTVVEPLIPAPVNVNTASVECLTALLANLRQPAEVRQTEQGSIRSTPPAFAAAAARQLAEDIALLRVRTNQEGTGPFAGWQDLVERLWRPRLEAAATMQDRNLLLNVYRNLQTGRDTVVEMGTAPICFQSGPWVGYRAAASRSRSSVDPAIRARHERTGVAAAVPGFTLERRWATQEQFEDAFLLDRRAPFWTTNPVNVGAIPPNSLGNDPAGRFAPHLLVYAFPQMGFGQARFPARDDAAAGIQPMPASAMPSNWNRSPTLRVQDTLAFANDVRGHDVGKQGALSLVNTGPSQPQGQPGQGQGQNPTPRPATTQQGGGRHDQISFPFSTADSFVGKFGLSAWFEPQSLGAVTLFEHGDGNDQRNRLAVEVRDGNLLLESIDEAGLDPNPGASPAGVPRTATQVALPLAELGLPANTPVHVSFQASGGRPSDLALHVDGFPRGRAKYRTYLTAALPVYDPQRANNATLPGVAGNEKYVDLQVESTEGFPQVGLLRIGAELFEYTSIRGNTFRCQFNDSMGGRAARQVGREMRPDIPVDAQGNPTVDFNSPQLQNVNLDVFPAHPAGSLVELAGWSLPLSEDTPMMVDKTTLDGAIGGFAVARAYIDNPRPITISIPQGPSFPIGTGIDENWSGTLLLADPVPSGRTYPPSAAQEEISNAFPTTGGYALLVQGLQRWDRTQATTSASATFGGVEVIRYAARQGNQLSGVQRAQNQAVPGQDGQISRDQFDGRPRRFVVNYEDYPLPNEPGKVLDDLPTEIVFVVPISLPVVNPQVLWDPQTRQLTEWCQLLPAGGSAVDTEWVRYDCIADRKHIVRGNRAAWEAVRFMLTNRIGAAQVDVGPLGPNSQPSATTPPWMQVSPTSGYIGYIPQIESTWPQIHAARNALAFRGDPFTGTSSHPQPNATVMACHRMQLNWGNFGAYTGRAGRLDRVAMVQGSTASGTQRPPVEWQTVNWSCRRYGSDNLQQNQTPPERLGPWPFQLIAFQDRITNVYLGPPRGTPLLEPRRFDRLVKFPSGELPAAWCEQPTLGAGLGNAQAMQGVVDEVELVQHARPTLVLDDDVAEAAQSFRVQRSILVNAAGPMYFANDLTPAFPQLGGLVQIDDEVVAYQSHADGSFQVAQNGRGLLNTQPRAHSRGARVEFLSTRPAAILAGGVGIRDAVLPLQDSGALPSRYGTVLLGQELLHYTWVRRNGDQLQLEMPRHQPPADEGDQQPRGLFRGRYGTTPATGSAGQPVVMFPFRYWDRHVDRSDDPELAYFQMTQSEAPGYFRSLRWREETQDPRVDVVCRARIDGKLGWDALPAPAAGLFELRGGSADAPPHRLAHFGARLELRFATRYQPGCVDLATYRAHGWKTTAKIEDVRVEYEGQRRVMVEEVTAR